MNRGPCLRVAVAAGLTPYPASAAACDPVWLPISRPSTAAFFLEQAIAVLGEDRWHPHGIVRREPDKPAVEQIVIQLLHELPLAANGVEDLQQARRSCSGGIEG